MITTRRQFLVGGLQVTAALPTLTLLGRAERASSRNDDDRVLVVLQLSGGNDALNTLVPFRQDAYYRSRPAISLTKASLHRLDDEHGLHPAMAGTAELFAEGRVAVVHGVGYPSPSRSHFRSMEIWHTADPVAPPGDVGWMGNLADQIAVRRPGTMAALHVGTEDLPLALHGREYFSPTVRDARGFSLEEPSADFARRRGALLERGTGTSEIAFLREAARSTYRAAERMAAAASTAAKVEYPGYGLAQRLRLVARLIEGGFGTRIFHVALGGFDTHARQAPTHRGLLTELSASLTAFQRDLEACGNAKRIVTMVFSEFGRRVEENASKGTDHGSGAPVFLVGHSVRGGLHGTPPDLTKPVEGDVPFTTDFRAVYTTLAKNWMGLHPSTAHAGLDLIL